ncbi:hypothetical protein DPMN_137227 [Dreissena polymorpha]|uniref:Uncharacterized protein n=1 Tax=Dreissena polymorpha TaxID=45954 RepID=A0A9D4G1H8_DREPO|nr:hypothetical protein DPMN_137227 [Dreissena polymorpha]
MYRAEARANKKFKAEWSKSPEARATGIPEAGSCNQQCNPRGVDETVIETPMFRL